MAINLQIGANVTQASAALSNLTRNVAAFGSGVQRVVPIVNNLGGGLNNIRPGANNAGSGLTNLRNNSNQATNSLMNLGRVVQDAPFGFLGIANNLNPLLESFQRLRESLGSNTAALRALGSSLTGPAGIGIALSVVSSLLIVFGNSIFGSKNKVTAAQIENERYAQSLKKIADELDFLRGRFDFESDIEKLNLRLQGLTGGRLDLAEAGIDLKNAGKNIKATTQAIAPVVSSFNQARIGAQKVVEEYDNLNNSIAANQKLLNDLPQTASVDQKLLLSGQILLLQQKKQAATTDKLAVAYKQFFETGAVGEKTLTSLSKAEKAQVENLLLLDKTVREQGKNVQKAEDDKVKAVTKSSIAQKTILKEQQEAAKEAVDNTISLAKRIQSEFPGLLPATTIESVLFSKQQSFNIAQQYIKDFYDGLKTGFARTPTQIPVERIELIPAGQTSLDPTKLFKSFVQPVGLAKVIDFSRQARLEDFAKDINGLVIPAVDNLIDSLARGENAFQAFGNFVKGILLSVIKKIIETALASLILRAIVGGLTGGTAGSAAGNLLGNFAGFRAAGGPVSAGRGYIVGENGPEWFEPKTNGSIVSNNQLSQGVGYTAGMGAVRVVVSGSLRGSTLKLQSSRTDKTQRRVA